MRAEAGRSAIRPRRRPLSDETASGVRQATSGSGQDILAALAKAREPIPDSERHSIHAGACGVAVLAALDVIEAPGRRGSTAQAVRDLLKSVTAGQIAVLLESLPAREAHAVIDGLIRVAVIDPKAAQVAHMQIDLRPTPAPVASSLVAERGA